jgi:hypothetical protein
MGITIQYIAGFFDGEGSIGIYFSSKGGCSLRTQLTQNKSKESKLIVDYLQKGYGGNISEQKTLSQGIKYNWQLNAKKCSIFLEKIEPYLILKKKQAHLAILWQAQRPERVRDSRGRIILTRPTNKNLDKNVSILLKKMKIGMENAKDLVKIEAVLKQILNAKGD